MRRRSKLIKLLQVTLSIVISSLTVIFISFWYPIPRAKYFFNAKSVEVHKLDLSIPRTTKKILLYTDFFGHSWGIKHGSKAFQDAKCPVRDCFIVDNQIEFGDFSLFDAVIFHLEDLQRMWISPNYLNRLRTPNQRFIAFLAETPQMSIFKRFSEFKDFFNWTMTYRRDSDIFNPYGGVRPLNKNHGSSIKFNKEKFKVKSLPEIYLKSVRLKDKLVLWLASNCDSFSDREHYVAELEKYIKVDTFGKCGKPECPRFTSCDGDILKRYKFYLSFENSICEDYITEKLFRRINDYIIPVVLGGANYSFLPEHSYIDVRDFESPQDLAKYLNYLDQNEEEYLSYFWWRQKFHIFENYEWTPIGICDLCDKLHNDHAPKTYVSLKKWLKTSPDGSSICQAKGTHPWSKFKNSNENLLLPTIQLSVGKNILIICFLIAILLICTYQWISIKFLSLIKL